MAVPPEVAAVPTMLGPEELQALYWLARDYLSPKGAVVDAGCFLGGSSAALLAGLRDREPRWDGVPLRSYDLFEVEPYTVEQFFSGDRPLRVGDSFRSRYDDHVAGYGVAHVVNDGDIATNRWPGGPIDVLFVDVMKSWDLVGAVHRQFLPHLVPGRSVIVHQDYGYGVAAWIHISVELIWDHLEHVASLEPCATHLFLLKSHVPEDLLQVDLGALPDQEKLRLMQRAVDRWTGHTRGMLEAAQAFLLVSLGRRAEGLELLDHVSSSYDEPAVQACADRTAEIVGTP